MTDSTSPTVVITRPLAQAEPLARQVAASGRPAVVFPLLEISPIPDTSALRAVLQDLRRFALVAFVSPNAVDAALAHLADWPREVDIAVVGEGSRTALARHGVTAANARIHSPRDPARTDSETLLQALEVDRLRGQEVLIVRGETGRELLAEALRSAGARVVQVAAYRRSAPSLDEPRREQLRQLLENPNVWIITSSEALRNLVDLAGQSEGDQSLLKLQRQTLIVPHQRIAETAKLLGLYNVRQTGSGDEQLLAALQSEP